MDQQENKGNEQLKHLITKKGIPRAAFTLKCEFNDGNEFTYRSDINLDKYKAMGYKDLTELDALVLKYSGLKKLLHVAKIFNNSAPAGEDLMLHHEIGIVVLNNLPKRYKL